jgi:1-acyl-sn-glycerol-3-phosphate acyltransferase
MTMTPHINPQLDTFPGDPSPQPHFGLRDTIRSTISWSLTVPTLAVCSAAVVGISKFADTRKVDGAMKAMSRFLPQLAGVKITVENRHLIDRDRTYVFIINHVNILDMFAIYQAIPQYTRSLEHVDHFSWPLIGPLISAAGQIPVDPSDPKVTARGLKRATEMLKAGDSLVVLPEGSRTLDGSLGEFYPGAFRLAIKAGVPVAPMAIYGGRSVSRRGDWRIRPGKMIVSFADPIPTRGLTLRDSGDLAARSRDAIIDELHRIHARNRPSQVE